MTSARARARVDKNQAPAGTPAHPIGIAGAAPAPARCNRGRAGAIYRRKTLKFNEKLTWHS
jgi:hypothetical protein